MFRIRNCIISDRKAIKGKEMNKLKSIASKMDHTLKNVRSQGTQWLSVIESKMELKSRILWMNVITMALLHVITLWAFFAYGFPVKWQTVLFNYVLYMLSSFGVAGGAHRYWSHRSFSASVPMRIFLALAFSLSGQKTIYAWVRDHRVHHKYVDTDADPHSIKRGFFFAHIGWNLMKKLPAVIERGNQVDMSDITNDSIASFYDRHWRKMVLIFSYVIPISITTIWGESWTCSLAWRLIDYLASLHSTWAINSFAHFTGYRPFNRKIEPTDNKILSLVVGDEGYHNYHHTFPWDYSTSELGYMASLSLTTPILDACSLLGWTYGLKKPSPQLVAAVAASRGDGSCSEVLGGRQQKNKQEHCHEEVPEDWENSYIDKTS